MPRPDTPEDDDGTSEDDVHVGDPCKRRSLCRPPAWSTGFARDHTDAHGSREDQGGGPRLGARIYLYIYIYSSPWHITARRPAKHAGMRRGLPLGHSCLARPPAASHRRSYPIRKPCHYCYCCVTRVAPHPKSSTTTTSSPLYLPSYLQERKEGCRCSVLRRRPSPGAAAPMHSRPCAHG